METLAEYCEGITEEESSNDADSCGLPFVGVVEMVMREEVGCRGVDGEASAAADATSGC